MADLKTETVVDGNESQSDAGVVDDVSQPVEDSAKQSKQVDGGLPALLGQVAWLMMQSPTHKYLFLADMEWLLVPAVMNRQFRLFRNKNVPFAYASWAFVSPEVEERLKAGNPRMQPGDWKSGENLWLIDFVAPFGGEKEVIKELKEKTFKGHKIKTLQPAPDGVGMAVVEW